MGLFKTKKYSTEPNSRYHPSMPEEQWKEKHFLLCVDNAPYDFFKRDEDKMQGLFLQGINRHTDKWTISGDKPGTTLTFHTFCRKMVSSCFPINDKEIQRRCLFVQCEKSEDESIAHLMDLTLCKLSDSTLETIEKFCVFRGQATPFPINFSMSNMECSQLYELLFNSEIIYLHPDCHAMNCEFYPF